MVLTPSQKIIAKDRHRFRVVRAGRRFGKTFLSVEEIKGKALGKPRRIAYFATTYQQARDICWELLKKELLPAATQINESRLEIRTKTQRGGESIIQLKGWESVETSRGQQFDFLVLDEIASMKSFWISWQEILRPTLTDTKGEALFISTPKGFNHFYDLCNEELTDNDFKTFHFTSYDNPYLPVDELESAKQSLAPESFLQEYMASFQKTQGLVYKEFDRETHLYDTIPRENLLRVAGVDFGFRNPAAVLDIRTNGEIFFVEDEWYKQGRTDLQIAEYVSASKFNEVYPDPESPGAIEELKRKNINVREVIKGKDSIEAGIKKIKELLISRRLKINKRCVNLISEFEMYSYEDEKAEKNQQEKPIKANDHCLVGSTMITMANGHIKRLDEVKAGEIVKSEKGNNKVLLSRLTRKKEKIYCIELSNGYSLRGTGDHNIYTDRGKIAIDLLRYDDNIKVLETNQILLWKNQSYSIIKDITGMADIIALSEDVKMAGKGCIKQYGNIITEKSQKGITSTIAIEIERITNSLTCNLYRLSNIYRNIIKTTGRKKSLEKKLEKTLIMRDYLRSNGIHLNRVFRGTNFTPKSYGKAEKELLKIVKFAEKNIKHISPQEQDFAIRIVRRKRCGREDVYNLTVENEHNYYANGILVKNCLDALRYVIMMKQPEPKLDQFKYNLQTRTENSTR